MRTVANRTERERIIDIMIEKNCPHCGAAMPEEAHYCLQCMTPCTPAQPSTAYLKSCAEHSQKRINRKQISSVLATMILLVVLIPSALAAPLHQQNAATAEGALTGTVQAAETESEEQPKTLLGKVKKAAKKAEQKIQSATGKMKEAVGIAPTAEEKQAMANEAAEQAAQQAERDNRSTGNRGNTGNTNYPGNGGASTGSGHGTTGTTAPSTNGTTKPGSTTTTTTTQPATQPENTALPKPEYNKYEYTLDGDYAKVTKYTGNAKVVVLPAAIDGHQVKYYCTGTFTDKDIELAVFEDFEVYHTLWVQNAVFKDCKKLKKVVFPNHADLGILPNFALGCTALSKIEIDNWQYKMQDGVLYYYNTNSWAAQYYCEGYTATRWNVAEYCTAINCEASLKNNAHIHELRLNSYVSCPAGYKLPESLQAIYVAEDNKQYFSKGGVLYYGPNTNNPNRLFCYPADKPAVTYTIPENTVFDMGSVKNKHLKTLVIPKSATVYDSTLKYICRGTVFPNLETIKVQKGSPHVDYIRTTFTGKVIVY